MPDRLDMLKSRLWRWTHPGRRVGLALGVFDFCHDGHVNLLRRAASRCDRLIVGVHTDEAVQAYKGVRPLNSSLERRARIAELDLADVVEIDSDRLRLCRRHGVNVVFHGDDWARQDYERHWGAELLASTGVEVELLPHTPGIDSTRLRREAPRVGWWLYSRNADWNRSHLHDHLAGLFSRVGGVWIVGDRGRATVKEQDPDAPCAWLPAGTELEDACRHVAALDLDVLVTAHFNHEPMVKALARRGHACHLVVLSHGRSGKAGTSHDVRRRLGLSTVGGHDTLRHGCVTIHDWSYAADSYGHLDAFLGGGGSLTNPAPAGPRPRLLVLPTWGPDADGRGLLVSKPWVRALHAVARDWDVIVSPHPLNEGYHLRRFGPGVTLLPAGGRSFMHVPTADAVLADVSGVLWESLLFDTPVLLAAGAEPPAWDPQLRPTADELLGVVPAVAPADLTEALDAVRGRRRPQQRALAEQRLGRIDGLATRRTADRIRALAGTPFRPGLDLDLPEASSH
ncbi:MAG TPA: adenylyltransferase/cytidyltransferase family protein [Candidatus Krumholzibacteria bacterium]|nr:adenylyltransferase/cytidyltransferase family protein [Candidatus Krumholzibacteria bacterium]